MSKNRKANGTRVYILRVEYNKNTHKVTGLQEEFRETDPSFTYGELSLEDYWDDDAMKLMDQMFEVGVS